MKVVLVPPEQEPFNLAVVNVERFRAESFTMVEQNAVQAANGAHRPGEQWRPEFARWRTASV